MKTSQQWFDEYAVSHQNKINQKIHMFCVPMIYFNIIGMLMSINSDYLQNLIGLNNPLIENWSTVILIFVLLFYRRLSFNIFYTMLIFSVFSIIGNYYLATLVPLFYFSISVFILAWMGQFYGHYLEGKKPSFFKDIQFLLIGPPWVFKKIFKK